MIPDGSTPYFYSQAYGALKPMGIELYDLFRFFPCPRDEYKGSDDPNKPDNWECKLPYEAMPDQPACLISSSATLHGSNVMLMSISLAIGSYYPITSI